MIKIMKWIIKCLCGFNHKWKFITKAGKDDIWACENCKKLVYDRDLIFLYEFTDLFKEIKE